MNKFKELIRNRRLPVTLEAPLIRDRENLENFLKLFREYDLNRWIIGINTLNHPMGNISTDPIILGHLIQKSLNIESIPHISLSLENNYTLSRWLLGASLLNINNLLLLSGDIRIDGNLSLREAVEIINMFKEGRVTLGDREFTVPKREFFIGGALIPERKEEHKRALFKIELGMGFFQTQVVFNSRSLKNVITEIGKEYEDSKRIHILVSIVPMLNERIANIFGRGVLRVNTNELSKLSNREYVSYIETVFLDILNLSDKLNDSISIGLHIIPVFWNHDITNNIVIFLSNLI